MTTLAIIGSGLVGRSLIYTLAKERKGIDKITLFFSDNITLPCTLHSTAIVASRGISSGHSILGDMLVEGFEVFSKHVTADRPSGIENVIQYSGATVDLDHFKKRHPSGVMSAQYLNQEIYLSQESAFMVDPKTYLDWLLKEAREFKQFKIESIEDMVVDIQEGQTIGIKTLNGNHFSFDHVIFACGSYNRFWKNLAPETKLKTSKPSQGSYFEFNDLDWSVPSFSFTLDGDNIIWNHPLKRLFIGSTTSDSVHYLAPLDELRVIYEKLSTHFELKLPPVEKGVVRVGLREKAQKREPYLVQRDNLHFIGGFYKNAFTLALKMSRDLSRQFL